ncbi:Ferrichrome-iron receptor [Klebsiella pneumoniae IS43]|uniref:Ferrichrome-iron receptor n=1 Tax=Klebsiella pneumoniae IS43 TaxID=1432552 RepID=W1DL61_KLEPN|nr:Ferrichrome-iron receptor [Klebsiella pneumoniae IS43]
MICAHNKKISLHLSWKKNASLPFGSFNSLALFTGLCLGASPAAGITAENSVKNSEETLVVEAAPPSLYSPGASADPKFNKPLVDTTRTITVIPEQVIKIRASPT